MSVKKFIAPNLAVLVILSFVWLAGIDRVYVDNNHHENLSKYLQVQQRIVDNYVSKTHINVLFRNSMTGFTEALNGDQYESTVEISGTPADTLFNNLNLSNYRDAFSRFEEAYLYIANNYPDRDMDLLTEKAIQGMLTTLDPHSVYIKPEDSK
ncbi:MAG: S41 family peptidase, partial [Balneolaceae bacterium]